MNYIILIAIAVITWVGIFCSSYYGAKKAIEKKRFIVKFDKEKEEVHLEPIPTAGKATYLPDATAEELREMDRDPLMKRFLKKFAKPEK